MLFLTSIPRLSVVVWQICCLEAHISGIFFHNIQAQTFPEDRLPLSYSHLLFRPTLMRFPVDGLGVPGVSGNRLEAVLTLKELVLAFIWLDELNEDRRPL